MGLGATPSPKADYLQLSIANSDVSLAKSLLPQLPSVIAGDDARNSKLAARALGLLLGKADAGAIAMTRELLAQSDERLLTGAFVAIDRAQRHTDRQEPGSYNDARNLGPRIVPHLKHASPIVRAEAAKALGSLGWESATAAILNAFAATSDPRVITAFAKALTRLKTDTVGVSMLIEKLGVVGEDTEAIKAIAGALRWSQCSLISYGDELRPYLQSKDPIVQSAVAEALAAPQSKRFFDKDVLSVAKNFATSSDELLVESAMAIVVARAVVDPSAIQLIDEAFKTTSGTSCSAAGVLRQQCGSPSDWSFELPLNEVAACVVRHLNVLSKEAKADWERFNKFPDRAYQLELYIGATGFLYGCRDIDFGNVLPTLHDLVDNVARLPNVTQLALRVIEKLKESTPAWSL